MAKQEKFVVTREEFLAPMRLRRDMDEIVAESMRAEGKSEQEIADHLELINEDND